MIWFHGSTNLRSSSISYHGVMTAAQRPLRADAARNRDKLLATATRVFGERGLDAPLEDIARRAGVSIGTLYNHFPTREALVDAIVPERLAALERFALAALAESDPWQGFVLFVEGVFTLQAQDQGLNDALANRFPLSPALRDACHRGLGHAEEIIGRAQRAGALRADLAATDLVPLMWALSEVIRRSVTGAPQAWRRHLALVLDGLRAGAAHPLPAPPLDTAQVASLTGLATD
jgi:AcrR family transcriptional regulator